MSKGPTQAECCKSFAEMAKGVITGIDAIDKATPANPNYPDHEPTWWVEMIAIQRQLQEWVDRHAH